MDFVGHTEKREIKFKLANGYKKRNQSNLNDKNSIYY